MDATHQTYTVNIVPRSPAIAPPSGERALKRMRVYTSISLATVVLVFCGVVLLQTSHPALVAAVIVTSLVTTAYAVFWENGAPLALTIATFVVSTSAWVATVALGELPGPYFFVALAFGIFGFTRRRARWARAFAAALVVGIAPVIGAALLGSDIKVYAYIAAVIAALVASFGLFALNRYGFNLYLEIDDARRVGAELAVVQERYRFAADLHDIQGHTLHVIRLKMQLADKLLDRDPDSAHAHLREAQELIAETLADTRSLAFGDRHVAFASELANAEALLIAAGIDWSVTGSLPRGTHDELFGLVMREATTNILRHAQATAVSVDLAPGRISIVNDGSPRTGRTLSGLATLSERFDAVGGSLRTDSANGTFTTTAEAT
jgi:two-component system, NarL family, sensor histidine kinase DesK